MLSFIDSSNQTPAQPTPTPPPRRDGRPGRLVVALLLVGALVLAIFARVNRVKIIPDAATRETTEPFPEPEQAP